MADASRIPQAEIESVSIETILLLCLSMLVIRYWWQVNRGRWRRWWKRTKDRLSRHWHPKSPHDCPYCQAGVKLQVARVNQDVRPWREQKSRRGAKKYIRTQGLACQNPDCSYCGVTDEQLHALVGNGKRGKDHGIQYLKCQACHIVFTCCKGTPLYYMKTKSDRVEMVLWFLVEGVDLSLMVWYTGHGDAALARWLNRMGEHSAGLDNVFFRNLVMALVHFDELYARVRTVEKARWLWLAIDPVSKALPSLHQVDAPVPMPMRSCVTSRTALTQTVCPPPRGMDYERTSMRSPLIWAAGSGPTAPAPTIGSQPRSWSLDNSSNDANTTR